MTTPPKTADSKTPHTQLQIQVPPEVATGAYINLSLMNHTETEFVFDFVFVQPLEPRASVRSRIITSPKHAKRILMSLQENIARYEQRYGVIEINPDTKPMH